MADRYVTNNYCLLYNTYVLMKKMIGLIGAMFAMASMGASMVDDDSPRHMYDMPNLPQRGSGNIRTHKPNRRSCVTPAIVRRVSRKNRNREIYKNLVKNSRKY